MRRRIGARRMMLAGDIGLTVRDVYRLWPNQRRDRGYLFEALHVAWMAEVVCE